MQFGGLMTRPGRLRLGSSRSCGTTADLAQPGAQSQIPRAANRIELAKPEASPKVIGINPRQRELVGAALYKSHRSATGKAKVTGGGGAHLRRQIAVRIGEAVHGDAEALLDFAAAAAQFFF